VRRYFLRVAKPGATLVATVTLPDSAQHTAKAILYEPNGAPFRELARDSIVPIGGSQVGTARFAVRAEDAVAGVYELDVVAPPRSGTVATVRAQLAPLTLADREATNPGQAIVSGRVTQVLLGAERALDVAGRGATPESLTVSVPDWAATAVVEVEVPREQWREFTDFGVTEFDSAGQQVSRGRSSSRSGGRPSRCRRHCRAIRSPSSCIPASHATRACIRGGPRRGCASC